MTQTFTPAQRIAILCIGVIGVLIPGLQPQLLGALAVDGRVDEAMLGHVATIELLAMGIAAGGAGIVFARVPLRWLAAAGIALGVGCDLLTAVAGVPLLIVRAGAGLAEGVLIWLAIGLIVRSATPARWSAVFLVAQTAAQLALATLFAVTVIPAAGSGGGFAALALTTAAGLLALPWLPRAYAPLTREDDATAVRIPARGFVALGGVLSYLAFIVVVWVYVEPLAAARGIGAPAIATIAPASLAMQIVGALLAMRLAGKTPALAVLLAVGAINLLLLGMLAYTDRDAVFLAATSAFGFFWLFALPFHVSVAIAADSTRRAAELVGGAQLLGSALGPFAGGLLVNASGLDTILSLGAAFLMTALLLFVVASRRARSGPTAPR